MTAAESLDPDESLWHAIAFHLRYERQKRGMSQTAVGDIIGVNKHGVSNMEAGRNKLTRIQADRLDKAWDTGGLFARMRHFARLSHNPDWPARVDRYQREASQLKIFHNSFIPLPFQTEDYHEDCCARVMRPVWSMTSKPLWRGGWTTKLRSSNAVRSHLSYGRSWTRPPYVPWVSLQ